MNKTFNFPVIPSATQQLFNYPLFLLTCENLANVCYLEKIKIKEITVSETIKDD